MASFKVHELVNEFFYDHDIASLAEVVRATSASEADVLDVLAYMTAGKYPVLRRVVRAGVEVFERAPQPESCYFCDCIIDEQGDCACFQGGRHVDGWDNP